MIHYDKMYTKLNVQAKLPTNRRRTART